MLLKSGLVVVLVLVGVVHGQYVASGWRPSGPSFSLPAKLTQSEFKPSQQEYGAPKGGIDLRFSPQDTLSAPSNVPALPYGPPEEATTTELPDFTTTDQPEQVQGLNLTLPKQELKNEDKEQGVYYIYHPTGLLQKVSYETKDDQSNMAYSAQLKYENVEPIRQPVYTYDPKTLVFQRLQ